jgi:murein DD-endopeptidase MepM/ murein hydrolase activator NlpD
MIGRELLESEINDDGSINEDDPDSTFTVTPTSNTVYDSWWSSYYVGQAVDNKPGAPGNRDRTTPMGLLNAGAADFVLSIPIAGPIIGGLIGNGFVDGICFVYNTIITGVMQILGIDILLSAIIENVPVLRDLGKLYRDVMFGGEFYPDDLYPSLRGTSDLAGASYEAQVTKAQMGAGPVTPTVATALNKEANRYLAEEYSKQSLYAKLFDPEDYRSGLSTLARKSGWNTTDGSIATHLANVVKTFAAMPTLIASSAGAISSAYADSDFDALVELNNDMAIQNMDWTADARARLAPDTEETAEGEDYDILKNTGFIMKALGNTDSDNPYTGSVPVAPDTVKKIAKESFFVNIDDEGIVSLPTDNTYAKNGDAMDEKNEEDEAINLTTLASGGGQKPTPLESYTTQDEQDIYKHLQIYLFDYNMMAGGACLENSDCSSDYGLENVSTSTVGRIGNGQLSWPVQTDNLANCVTSEFGPRWGTVHEGIDLGQGDCTNGKTILAAADGVVRLSNDPSDGSGYGNWIIIDHPSLNLSTVYAHGQDGSRRVNAGDTVTTGQPIMLIGTTGDSTGPHLHFEVHDPTYHNPVNPRPFLGI